MFLLDFIAQGGEVPHPLRQLLTLGYVGLVAVSVVFMGDDFQFTIIFILIFQLFLLMCIIADEQSFIIIVLYITVQQQ